MKNIDFFKNITEKEIENILKKYKYKVKKYAKNEYVVFRGDVVKGLYVCIKGNLISQMSYEDGNSKNIEELKNGKTLASAFIFGKNSYFPVDLVAKTDVEIFFIEKSEVLKILVENEKILLNFIGEISDKAQFLSKNLWNSLAGKKIDKKLAEYILEKEKNNIFEMDITVKELAEYFGVSRPSLSRVMKNFLDEKILEKIENKRYRIICKNRLEEI